MNFLKNAVALIILSISAIGCATGVGYSEHRTTLQPVAEGNGRVWFYRPSKLVGAAIQPKVNLTTEITGDTKDTSDFQWEVVGKAQPGCFFVVERPIGTYGAKCTTEWKNETKVQFVRDQERFMRMTVAPGIFVGHILLRDADQEKALKEIQKCKLIDGVYPNQSRLRRDST